MPMHVPVHRGSSPYPRLRGGSGMGEGIAAALALIDRFKADRMNQKIADARTEIMAGLPPGLAPDEVAAAIGRGLLDRGLDGYPWLQDAARMADERRRGIDTFSDPEGVRGHADPLTGEVSWFASPQYEQARQAEQAAANVAAVEERQGRAAYERCRASLPPDLGGSQLQEAMGDCLTTMGYPELAGAAYEQGVNLRPELMTGAPGSHFFEQGTGVVGRVPHAPHYAGYMDPRGNVVTTRDGRLVERIPSGIEDEQGRILSPLNVNERLADFATGEIVIPHVPPGGGDEEITFQELPGGALGVFRGQNLQQRFDPAGGTLHVYGPHNDGVLRENPNGTIDILLEASPPVQFGAPGATPWVGGERQATLPPDSEWVDTPDGGKALYRGREMLVKLNPGEPEPRFLDTGDGGWAVLYPGESVPRHIIPRIPQRQVLSPGQAPVADGVVGEPLADPLGERLAGAAETTAAAAATRAETGAERLQLDKDRWTDQYNAGRADAEHAQKLAERAQQLQETNAEHYRGLSERQHGLAVQTAINDFTMAGDRLLLERQRNRISQQEADRRMKEHQDNLLVQLMALGLDQQQTHANMIVAFGQLDLARQQAARPDRFVTSPVESITEVEPEFGGAARTVVEGQASAQPGASGIPDTPENRRYVQQLIAAQGRALAGASPEEQDRMAQFAREIGEPDWAVLQRSAEQFRSVAEKVVEDMDDLWGNFASWQGEVGVSEMTPEAEERKAQLIGRYFGARQHLSIADKLYFDHALGLISQADFDAAIGPTSNFGPSGAHTAAPTTTPPVDAATGRPLPFPRNPYVPRQQTAAPAPGPLPINPRGQQGIPPAVQNYLNSLQGGGGESALERIRRLQQGYQRP